MSLVSTRSASYTSTVMQRFGPGLITYYIRRIDEREHLSRVTIDYERAIEIVSSLRRLLDRDSGIGLAERWRRA